jgi:hypothetical protein
LARLEFKGSLAALSLGNGPLLSATLPFCHPVIMGLRPTQGMKKASVRQLLFIEPLPLPLSSRAYPDFLLHCSHRRPRMWFSLKRTARSRLKPQPSTGNLGKPRDLRCAIRVPRPYRPTTSTNHPPNPHGNNNLTFGIPSSQPAYGKLREE